MTAGVEDVRSYEINAAWLGYRLDIAMEAAGDSVARLAECLVGGLRGARVAVLAGKGGNGGDGLVAARRMALRGARVDVYLAFRGEGDVSRDDVKAMLRLAARTRGVEVHPWEGRAPGLEGYDVVVDALLGVGSRGEPRGAVAELLGAYNSSAGLRISVDVPSGLDADTGEASSVTARSDATVAMHWVKPGLLAEGAAHYVGDLYVAEVGFPSAAWELAGPGDLAARIPRRPRGAKKGDGGRVLVVGGSEAYVGAPLFAALGAMAAGVDLVYLAAPFAREAAIRYPDLVPRRLDEAASLVGRVHAVVVGPGLGVAGGGVELLESVVEAALRGGVPAVIDADGLKLLKETRLYGRLGGNVLLTPHRGEAAALLGERLDPPLAARRLAEESGAVVLVKAPVDVVCRPDGTCRFNETGAPEMSAGGTGDVLAGFIAGIAARRVAAGRDPDLLNAAAAGAFAVGLAGERVARNRQAVRPEDLAREAERVLGEAASIV